ncbi:MAG TPA: serine--tRNA ligase, partial [Galbitalea sp.]
MIDIKLVRDDPDRVRTSQSVRGEDPALVDVLLAADERRRAAVLRFDTVRASQKTLGKEVAAASGPDKQALLAHAKDLAAEVREAEGELTIADDTLRDASLALSNIIEPGVPEGGEDDFALIATAGTPPSFDFEPRDHVELGKLLGAIDVERAAKVSGSRFYYLTGVGALLELALVNMAMMQAVEAGFTPMLPPALVRSRAMEGTWFLGQ